MDGIPSIMEEGDDVNVREQVAMVSTDLAKTRKEVKEMRRLYAAIDNRLRKADWNLYADHLAKACKEVETWRDDIERERLNVASWLKQEVHIAFSERIDGLTESLHKVTLEIPEVESTCRDLSKRMDAYGSEAMDARITSLTNTLHVESLAIRRVETQFQALQNRLDVETTSRSASKQNLPDAVWQRMEDELHCLSARMGEDERRESCDDDGSTTTATRRLDAQDAKLSSARRLEEQDAELESASSASSPCVALQEQLERMKASSVETQVTMQRISEQYEDLLQRLGIETESYQRWKQRTEETLEAQGEENRNLSNLFSLLAQDWANLQERYEGQGSPVRRFRELEESFGGELSAEKLRNAPWVEKITAQMGEMQCQLASKNTALRIEVDRLGTRIDNMGAVNSVTTVTPDPTVKDAIEKLAARIDSIDMTKTAITLTPDPSMKDSLTDCVLKTLDLGHSYRELQNRVDALENRPGAPDAEPRNSQEVFSFKPPSLRGPSPRAPEPPRESPLASPLASSSNATRHPQKESVITPVGTPVSATRETNGKPSLGSVLESNVGWQSTGNTSV